jgi:hypothetical protein
MGAAIGASTQTLSTRTGLATGYIGIHAELSKECFRYVKDGRH